MRSRHGSTASALVALLVLSAPSAFGQAVGTEPPAPVGAAQTVEPAARAYFYHGLPGSDLYVGPLDVILNKGFNMSQADNRERHIFEARYATGHVRESVLHPFRSIERSGGWGSLLTEQVLPIQAVSWIASGFDWDAADNMTWYPNYFGHFIEGGITSRRLAEKYRAQGVPWATALAGASTMAANVVNELYTHPHLVDGTAGTTADLYLFDLGGIIVFSFDPVARFFAQKLHADVWTGQAALTLDGLELTNNANHLVFKIPLPFIDRASLFFRTAVGSHLGTTLHLNEGYDLSIGFGADTKRQNIDPVTGHESVDIGVSASVWLDRGGSVLASAYWAGKDHRLLTVNVFPGVLHPSFGGWLVLRRDKAFEIGLSHRNALGLALGAGIGG